MHKSLEGFCKKGGASFLVGGQWGSEAKGCAAAWVAYELSKEGKRFDIVTTNAGAQAGHTSTHNGKTRIVYHLPTASLIANDELKNGGIVYLNAGSIIDADGLEKELNENSWNGPLYIHPMAAVITDECREAERDNNSSQTKIASTRKGVGQALSRKVLRSGVVAKDHKFLRQFVRKMDLNKSMVGGASVLVEVPQGVSLSLNHSGFYPHTTSRDCTPSSGMSDAGIHPSFYNKTMVVLRTFPIRVGHITDIAGNQLGQSGGVYFDQHELTWDDLGVKAEITTVTKRIRRVFTYSHKQVSDTFALCRPDVVFLSFCNYTKNRGQLNNIVRSIEDAAYDNTMRVPEIAFQWGPTTTDVQEAA